MRKIRIAIVLPLPVDMDRESALRYVENVVTHAARSLRIIFGLSERETRVEVSADD